MAFRWQALSQYCEIVSRAQASENTPTQRWTEERRIGVTIGSVLLALGNGLRWLVWWQNMCSSEETILAG